VYTKFTQPVIRDFFRQDTFQCKEETLQSLRVISPTAILVANTMLVC
jgi:hypothetical protein